MPSLKEIKNRIVSVNSTRKITSAMKMVASSKLHHAQQMIENMLPYENMLERILKTFLASEVDAHTIFSEVRDVKKVALVVYSSNSSLCGGYNANVIKMMFSVADEYRKTIGKDNVIIYPVGRKVAEQAKKNGFLCAGDYTELAEKPSIGQCIDIATELCEKYAAGEIDKVELIYHHFKSAGSQILQRRTFLPIDLDYDIGADNDRDLRLKSVTPAMMEYLRKKVKEDAEKKEKLVPLNDNFIVEPDMKTVLHALIPRYANLMIYTALLDSNASEHAARMVAMQTATDNADELLRELNLQFNKSRQQAITNELLDIVGGSVNN